MQQISEGFLPSPQQTRLWLLQQQCIPYRAHYTLLIEGALEIAALRRAVEAVLGRHEIFRTTFYRLPGMESPVQVINDQPLYSWQQISLETDLNQQDELNRLLLEAQSSPLNLEKGPLVQCSLLTLMDKKQIFYISTSPLHADIQTLSNLIQEVCSFYNNPAETGGDQESEVPQYVQFSEWQNSLLEEEEEGRAYWSRQKAQPSTIFPLPYERKGKLSSHFNPLTVSASIEPALQRCINTLLERYQCSFPVFLFTCWQVLLWRFINQDELLFGLGATGRIYDELHAVAGPIARYVPFLSRLDKQHRFCDFLSKIQKECEAHLAQQLYFAPKDPVATLLYPFGFDYYEILPEITAGGISFVSQQCYVSSEPFKIRLLALERSEAPLTLTLEYNADLYAVQDIQRLSEQLLLLFRDAVARPECALSELEILSAAERDLVLLKYNQTATPYPQEALLHQLFERQAVLTPDAIAVIDDEYQLTYQALNALSHQLAHYLQTLSIGPETLVGLYLERSAALVIAMLGVLKAGAAYVPLDLSVPLPRLRFIATDAHLKVVLTSQQLQARLTEWPEQTSLVSLEDIREQLVSTQHFPSLVNNLSINNLAYVIYTSGSTGEPKGVMISHQGAAHYVHWCSQYYDVASGWGVPVHSPIGFDLTVTALFAPLAVGRVVWLLEEGKELDELVEVLRHVGQWSLLKLTPAHLNLLNQQLEPYELAGSSRALILGGEALKGESIRHWQQKAPQTRLINEYGPTETVVGCCIYEIAPDEEVEELIPIGHPIANTRCYVLDEQGLPVPIGIAGELYIGGVGLSRGYVGRADLTAECFVPDLYCGVAGSRMYRTGDLARYKNQQGVLEYLGRIDRQVKVRGYRIELGEIEKLLELHKDVRECVVEVYDTPGLDKSLIAYVVPNSSITLESAVLHTYLSDQLPAYMVPESYKVLEALPLTNNGKIDRSLLPPPDNSTRKVAGDANAAAPRDMVEFQLLQIWEKTLKVRPILITDSFFDLGGHSILAVSLMAQIRKRLDIHLPLAILFEHKTIAALAAVVRQQLNAVEDQLPEDPRTAVPRDVVEFQLLQIWEETLQVHPIVITDGFFELGGDAILAERMLVEVRKRLGVDLSPALFSEHSTIAELSVIVRQQSNALEAPVLVTIQSGATTKLPLFFVHPAGGTVFCYTNLARNLGSDQPFYGLETPDFVGDGETYTPLAEMAARYITEMQIVQPEGPYMLGGWSTGGVMAFEIAQQLKKRNQKVALLALLDSNIPFTVRNPDVQIKSLDVSDAAIVQDIMSRKAFAMEEDISTLPPVEQLSSVLEEGKKTNLVPMDTDLEQFRRLWRVQMMNVHAVRSYVPEVYPDQIDLFRAQETIELGGLSKKPSTLPMAWALTGGWETLTSQEILVHEIPGSHQELVSRNVQLVATVLKSRLEQIESSLKEPDGDEYGKDQ